MSTQNTLQHSLSEELKIYKEMVRRFRQRDSRIEKLALTHDDEMDDLEELHDISFEKLESRHEQELEKLESRCTREVEELENRQEREMDRLEAEYADLFGEESSVIEEEKSLPSVVPTLSKQEKLDKLSKRKRK